MTARKVILLIVLLIVAFVVVAMLIRPTRLRPPMALYLVGVTNTAGVVQVHLRFENHPGNIAVRATSLLAPNGRDWEPVADMAKLRLNDWAVTVTPTNSPRRFVAEIQEQSTGLGRLKDLMIMTVFKIQCDGDVTLHNGRKTFVTNDVPFVSGE